MTPTLPADRPACAAGYAAALRRHAVRLLGARHRELSLMDVDDVAQDVVVTFLRDATSVMERYPSPLAYASASVSDRLEDWRRRERAQRSEGARLAEDADGRSFVKRRSEQLDVVDLDRNLGGADEASRVVARLHTDELLASLDEREAALVRAVDIEGRTVTESSVVLGLTRSYASRLHSVALGRLRDDLAEAWAC